MGTDSPWDAYNYVRGKDKGARRSPSLGEVTRAKLSVPRTGLNSRSPYRGRDREFEAERGISGRDGQFRGREGEFEGGLGFLRG